MKAGLNRRTTMFWFDVDDPMWYLGRQGKLYACRIVKHIGNDRYLIDPEDDRIPYAKRLEVDSNELLERYE